MSQVTQIQKCLDKGWTITQMDAIRMFGCYRLAARVKDLRNKGYPVTTQIIQFNGKKFAQYSKGRRVK